MANSASHKNITVHQLKSRLDQGLDFLLIHTLPGEHYQKQHLPGATHACVYEVTFLTQMEALAADRGQTIVLYGSSSSSRDAVTAAEKLIRLGYRDVYVLTGGLKAWREAGYRLEGEEPESPDTWPAALRPTEGRYTVDLAASFVAWTGRNANTGHQGMVRLKAGEIAVQDGSIAGTFVIDMRTIVNFTLEDEGLRKILIEHLKSDDFFFVERFPEATFALVQAKPIEDAAPGCANFEVEGKLTLRGLEGVITFPAVVEKLADGGLAAEAHFDLDRSRWGVIYGSGRYFEHLGMHLVYDPISIQVRLVAH
jgi:polyisoprenoid-binding protein YceI/rhodanese-related sulfurtransferase